MYEMRKRNFKNKNSTLIAIKYFRLSKFLLILRLVQKMLLA